MDPKPLQDVVRRHRIRLLLQFGSTVTGRARPDSDLDLAVMLDRLPETLQEHAALVQDLQGLYPGRQVDVAILNRADPLLLKQVTAACVLLHGTNRALAELKMYAFRRYQDHKKYFDLERAYVARAIGGVAR